MSVALVLRCLSFALLVAGVPLTAQARSGFVLRNDRQVAVTVEVRLDTGGGCDAAKLLATETIEPGKRWSFGSSQTVCWRRHANPGRRDGKWTAWRRHEASASHNEVTL